VHGLEKDIIDEPRHDVFGTPALEEQARAKLFHQRLDVLGVSL
jgi:hypothetical protein